MVGLVKISKKGHKEFKGLYQEKPKTKKEKIEKKKEKVGTKEAKKE